MATDADILAHFAQQADWCAYLGSPFTAALCKQFAQDYEARGPVYELCKNWSGTPRKDALALRLAGALHHAVLSGEDMALAAVYPAQQPDTDIADVWQLAQKHLQQNLAAIRAFIQSPPQTNETRRAIALLPGFLMLAARFDMPMDLLELGASAGLNQNWDRFNYQTDSWSRPGNSDVHITTQWQGPAPNHLDITPNVRSRAACDIRPLDISNPAEALKLKCYTWPDQTERLARLEAAIHLAVERDVAVDRADAIEWLAQKLSRRPEHGLTVIYHSVYLQYPPKEDILKTAALIEEAGKSATPTQPLAWLCYEPLSVFSGDVDAIALQTRLQVWPGGDVSILNTSDGHVTKLKSHGS